MFLAILWLYLWGSVASFVAATDDFADAKAHLRYALFMAITWPITLPIVAAMVVVHLVGRKST